MTPEQLDETLRAAISDAPALVDDLTWIETEISWPPGHDRDRPTIPHPVAADPDHVPGRRWDVGGNDRARTAYERAVTLTGDAHRLATIAVTVMHAYRGRDHRKTRLPTRTPTTRAVVESTVRRLRWLLDDGITRIPDGGDSIQRTAWSSAVQLLEAHAALQAVLRDVDGTHEPPAAGRCSNCQAPCGPDRRRIGRPDMECAACETYRLRWRRRGVTKLRPARHQDARDAKTRRVARGEDHARAPLPHRNQEAS